MLRSALRPLLGERATDVLECAGVAPTARAESLGLEEWATLAVCSGRGMRLTHVSGFKQKAESCPIGLAVTIRLVLGLAYGCRNLRG